MAHLNRREIATLSLAAGLAATTASARSRNEISHNNVAIHQEVVFSAGAERVYRVLTSAELFDKVVLASEAMSSSMKKMLGTAPTTIDAQSGGAFSLFGGYVTGRNLELVPNQRIVQAWRAGSWDAGLFSIAHFALEDRGATTRLVFDHQGFPNAEAGHLREGWHGNYWKPMAKVLANP